MKKVIFAGIAAALLTACSNDELVYVENDANAIRFGVTAENNSRAADVYCQNNPFGAFNVFATHEGLQYIDNDLIQKNGTAWENLTGLRYWPNDGDVTFYGYVNGTIDKSEPTAENGYYNYLTEPRFEEFAPEENVSKQVDLLYARKTQAKEDGTQVMMNFRHALSQIVFNARNDNKNLYVVIDGVSIVNVAGNGIYTLPTEDSDVNLKHEYGSAAYPTTGRGSWNLDVDNDGQVAYKTQYDVTFDKVVVAKTNNEEETKGEVVNLTDWSNHTATGATVEGIAADKALAMLLIPQETEKYDLTKRVAETTKNPDVLEPGSYFLVNCRIQNVSGADGVATDKDVLLWGGENGATKPVMIPVSFNWEEGKKYIYTFVFGNGNGGYDPDPEDPDEPDPVLVPITFDVEIDDFYQMPAQELETKSETTENNNGDEAAE